jgi:hypothetical protein
MSRIFPNLDKQWLTHMWLNDQDSPARVVCHCI